MIEEFHQLLHKVNSNELLSESHDKHNELKPIYDGMAGEEQLTSELVKIRARYKQACKELKIR